MRDRGGADYSTQPLISKELSLRGMPTSPGEGLRQASPKAGQGRNRGRGRAGCASAPRRKRCSDRL